MNKIVVRLDLDRVKKEPNGTLVMIRVMQQLKDKGVPLTIVRDKWDMCIFGGIQIVGVDTGVLHMYRDDDLDSDYMVFEWVPPAGWKPPGMKKLPVVKKATPTEDDEL